jgi:Leucine-rich repeat (LRR) protein
MTLQPTSIDISRSGLYTLPDVSAHHSIKQLNAAGNRIHVVWEESIPSAVEEVDLEGNSLTSDGLIDWPQTIVKLNLSRNPFTSVEQSYFTANLRLEDLNLSDTNLRYIDTLPPNLKILRISSTDIEMLPTLPKTLVRIEARNTRLRSLPAMPPALEYADFSSNTLRSGSLPSFQGTALKTLILAKNQLTKWPKRLPATLTTLNLARNSIAHIGAVPDGLQLLNIRMNRVYSVPEALLKRRGLLMILSGNCCIQSLAGPSVLASEGQWNEEIHRAAAGQIVQAWRYAAMRKRLRALKRSAVIRGELLALSMHPDRAGRFEDTSPQWSV